MKKYRNNTLCLGLLILLLVRHVGAESSQSLGEKIYHQGLASNIATLNQTNAIAANLFPCANCHGRRGEGSQEGGVVAPAINWSALSKPYQQTTTRGRQRSAYTLSDLTQAVRHGIDSSGQSLSTMMPRYDYTDVEISALLETLKKLSEPRVQGVDANEIRIALILDTDPYPDPDLSVAIVQSYFDQVNQQGGLFQRRLVLVVPNQDDDAFQVDCCLAILAHEPDSLPNWTKSIVQITVFSSDSGMDNDAPHFALYSGPKRQRQAFLQYAKKHNLVAPQWLVASKATFITNTGQHVLVTSQIKAQKNKQHWVIKPPGLALITERGKAEYLQIASRAKVPSKSLSNQLRLLAAAKLLVHSLKAIGRDSDKLALIKQLGASHNVQTHFGPVLNYGPGRKVGAPGAMIRQVNSKDEVFDRSHWFRMDSLP